MLSIVGKGKNKKKTRNRRGLMGAYSNFWLSVSWKKKKKTRDFSFFYDFFFCCCYYCCFTSAILYVFLIWWTNIYLLLPDIDRALPVQTFKDDSRKPKKKKEKNDVTLT